MKKEGKTFIDLRIAERKGRPIRVYNPPTLQEVLETMKSGCVLDKTIQVTVKDDWKETQLGLLPCQRVSISFEYMHITTDQGEIPFDKNLVNNGYGF